MKNENKTLLESSINQEDSLYSEIEKGLEDIKQGKTKPFSEVIDNIKTTSISK